jgi:hypothetical protein
MQDSSVRASGPAAPVDKLNGFRYFQAELSNCVRNGWRTHGHDCLNPDSSGPHGFSKSTDSTWTMVYRANQEFQSRYVMEEAINNYDMAHPRA